MEVLSGDRDEDEVGDAYDLEKALEYVPVEDRVGIGHEYQTRLGLIAQGKGGELVF